MTDNKVAIVTGASSGVGKAIAEKFAENGYDVVLAARSIDKLRAYAREFEASYHVRALPVQTDLSRREDIENLFTTTEKELGRLDVLVNVAGAFKNISFVNSTTSEFMANYDATHGLMQSAVIYSSKRALEMLRKTKGAIVIISSDAGLEKKVYPDQVHYHMTKAAVNHAARAMALELAQHKTGVSAFAIAPGNIDTPLLRRVIEGNEELVRLIEGKVGTLDDFYSRILQPEDVANKVFDVTQNPGNYSNPVIEMESFEF